MGNIGFSYNAINTLQESGGEYGRLQHGGTLTPTYTDTSADPMYSHLAEVSFQFKMYAKTVSVYAPAILHAYAFEIRCSVQIWSQFFQPYMFWSDYFVPIRNALVM